MVRVTPSTTPTQPLWTLSQENLQAWMAAEGHPPYRASQVWQWVWEKGVSDFSQMSNLPAALRQALAEAFPVPELQLLHERKSQDGTRKFLWQLPEGGTVETVWIPHQDRATVCVSSQVGCSLNCRFCATGQLGLERQLQGYEILLQVYTLKHRLRLPVTHIVYMGMGEPLLNYSAVIESLEGFSQKMGLSPRRITISTVGIPKGIRRLAERKEPFELAFSLHSAIPEKRQKLIPLAAHISLEEVREALITYGQTRQEWVTLEYVLLAGENDGPEDAEALRAFIAPPLQAKVNLIVYNPVPGLPFRPSPRLKAFQQALLRMGIITTIRYSRGADVAAGCGQLARQTG
ncbi:MAG: 23S rRNA (adenine(2503)-C(2))-methyltransferase RlmN [Bacteroidia bacterium]|nr:23S rRNA (adenine(2503)-C(2))-methyltransferase RlmN [Bacteroidia bacterium]GIV23967.1 MAG: putative dual-specificity RNA methyltransferase RlmN [Bacteroidia bacterium]